MPDRTTRTMLVAVAVMAAAVLSACTHASRAHRPSGTTSASVPGWTELPAPASGSRVLVLQQSGPELLAFGSVPSGAGRTPAAWSTRDGRSWQRIPVTAVTGYGQQAQLVMATVSDGHVSAFGQAVGGAHSLPRPTIWTGDSTGLAEHGQSFTMFGGEDAIAQSGETSGHHKVLLSGDWTGPQGRYSATVWVSADGAHWTRHADAPELSANSGEQTTARGITASPSGYLIVGATTSTGLDSRPLAWSSGDGLRWHRTYLPSRTTATAARAGCDTSRCLIIGASTTPSPHLLCWSLRGSGNPVGGEPGPGAGLIEPRDVLLRGTYAFVLTDLDGTPTLLSVSSDCRSWQKLPTPAHSPVATLGYLGQRLLLVTTDDSSSRLWLRTG